MSRRVRFGSTTDGTLDALDGQIDTGNESGNNPDNDLVIRDSTGTIVARYNESATTWQLEQPLDLQSNNVTNVGALDTENIDTGRDWDVVSDSRQIDVVETNDTKSEIKVSVLIEATEDNQSPGFSARLQDPTRVIDNIDHREAGLVLDNGDVITLQITGVPPGRDYEVNEFGDSGFEMRDWYEFRP